MSFTDAEAAYLRSHGLARFATVAGSGQPDLVPVASEFDGSSFWVGGTGRTRCTAPTTSAPDLTTVSTAGG